MIKLVVGAVVSIVLVLSPIWLWHYHQERDVETATREASNYVFRFGLGVAAVGSGIAMEFVDFMSQLGVMVAQAPGTISHSILGIIGYASLSGIINIQPETYGLIVIVVFGGYLLMR